MPHNAYPHVVNVSRQNILFTGSFESALNAAVTMAAMNPLDVITVRYKGKALCTVPHSLTGTSAPREAYRRPLGLRDTIADDCKGSES